MLKKTVTEYSNTLYDITDWAPIKMYVAVSSANINPLTAKGALQAVSPQEQIVAVYWALAAAVIKGITLDDVEKWKKHLLTAVFTFKVLQTDEEKEFETIRIRQIAAHTFAAITYTPLQWVCKIVQLKESRENNPSIGKQSSADIAKLFKKHEFKAALGQEQISETFIENALYIWTRALCYSDVQTVLINGAERFGHFSMFDSLSKIAQIIRKCKMEPNKLKWVFALMFDRVCENHVCVGDFSNQNLFGTKDKKGHLDVLLSMLELKDYLLTEFVPALNLDPSVGKMLISNYDSIATYRKKVPPLSELGNREASDLSWMAGWSIPQKNLASFIENILYKNKYDRAVKQNLANKQSAKEVLMVPEVAEDVQAIKLALAPPPANDTAGGDPKPTAPETLVDPRLKDEVSHIPANIDEKGEATIRKWQEHALLLVDQSMRLYTEPKDEKDVSDLLRAAFKSLEVPTAVTEGTERTYDIAIYDIKTSGEVVTHPHLRLMSFRGEHYGKLVRGFLRSHLPETADALEKDNYPDAAMIVTFDAGKHQGTHAMPSKLRSCN
jgi:hypothetical protein